MILSYFLPSFSSSVRKYVSGSFFLSFSRMHVVADPLPPFLGPFKEEERKGRRRGQRLMEKRGKEG